MEIINLKIKNFRSYDTLNLDFNKNINIFFGDNGVGKTNIIESIYVLALTKSFRGLTYDVLINNYNKNCSIEGEILTRTKKKYKLEISSDGKKAYINDNKVDKLSNYISKVQVIIFTPEDMNIIKDTPGTRRKFLNIELSQLDNNYLYLINNYNKLLKQRNSYLKTMAISKFANEDYLNVLTEKIVKNGMLIYEKRRDFIMNINNRIDSILKKISIDASLSIEYESDYKLESEELIISKYKKNLEKDLFLGQTSFGVHKDDIKYIYDEKDIRLYGSEGQQKNSIIAFKLAEIELFKKITGEYPILILDDLFSELDNKKIRNIFKLLKKNLQTFVTVTEIDKVDDSIKKNSTIFRVKKQKVKVIKNETNRK